MKEVLVIGGGPAGIFAALNASDDLIHVTVIDKNKEPLKKLLLTGNGKCNYWNQDQDMSHFHSDSKELLSSIFQKQHMEDVYEQILKMGIVPMNKDGYFYPYSMQSFTMKHAFLEEAKRKNIDFLLETEVLSVAKKDSKFEVVTSHGIYFSDAVVLSTGSRAYPKTGSDGKGYVLASSLGHKMIPVNPSLVSLEMDESYLGSWAGVRSHVKVSYQGKMEEGEIQLTKNGISGICVFNISREVAIDLSSGKKPVVLIDFFPFTHSVGRFLDEQNKKVKNRNIGTLLEAILNYKLVDVILKQCGISKDCYYDHLSEKLKNRLIEMLSSFPCKIVSTAGFESGQVCSGGVALKELNIESLESSIVNGLFFAGEILDIDGDCGGYNLETAFVSGMMAGKGVRQFLK